MPPQSSRGGQVENHEKVFRGDNKSSILIRALQASSSPKLTSINNLLRDVVQSARTVVKGTASQRRFNAQYTEFCRAALVGLADLEEAVYELEKEGVSGCQHEVRGIGENDFIKELAAYVSSKTDVLGPQYLEHFGLLAVSNSKLKQKATESKSVKGTRSDDNRQQVAEYRNLSRKNMSPSPSLAPNLEVEEPLPPVLSRGGVKLSSISSLSPWLMPWTIPMPNAHGVALDRITTERPKAEEIPKQSEEVSVMDICSTSTSMELLRHWEAREIAFSTAAGGIGYSSPSFAAEKTPASEENKTMFFPRKESSVRACVPSQVITELVHCGIYSLVF